MTKNPSRLLVAILCLAVAAGCSYETSSDSPVGPTPQPSSFAGTWTSGAIAVPDTNTCTNFQWNVTQVNGPTVSGQFSATCAGGLAVNGTGTGTTNASSLTWSATGTASQSGTTCPFSLSGTATPQSTNTIRIDYAGSVCGTAVGGTQILTKK
jgi:hypothetical protein